MKIKLLKDTAVEGVDGKLATGKKGETVDAADRAGAYLVSIGKAEAVEAPGAPAPSPAPAAPAGKKK